MLLVSSKWISIPFYGYIILRLYKAFGLDKTLWLVLAAAVMVVVTDQGSVHFFKEVFQRSRPCHNSDVLPFLTLINNKCGGNYGFISSHASNVFGLATFVSCLVLNKDGQALTIALFTWAAFVSFSRIYLAVHYPSDVLFGAFFGILVGYSVARITNKIGVQ